MEKKPIKKTILIVDDDPMSLELLTDNLTSESYQVMTALSGKVALEVIKRERPGLVLLDMLMPEMDGFETLKKIKGFDPEIPVAIVTAVWDNEEAQKTFEAGAYEYITKPIDMEYLKTAVLLKLFLEE